MMKAAVLSFALMLLNTGAMVLAQEGQAAGQNTSKGEAALAAGKKAEADGRWQEAINQYKVALTYLPGNADAVAGLDHAQVMLNQAPTSQDVARQRELQRQRAITEYNESYKVAQQRLKEGNYAGARDTLISAKGALDSRQTYLNPAEYADMSNKLQKLQDDVQAKETTHQIEEDQAKRIAAEKAQQEQRRKEKEERENKIRENFKRARQLQSELKYPEAMQVLDEILFMDENNPAALALHDTIQTTMMYRDYAETQKLKERGVEQQTVDNQKSTIIPTHNISGPGPKSISGLMAYPEDWPQISYLRTGGRGAFQESPQNREVWQKLQTTRIPPNFNGNTLLQVKDYLQSVANLNIYIDAKALANAGIDVETPITLQLQDVPISTALNQILSQLGEGDQRPRYDVIDGVLTISSDSAMRARTFLQVYDIRDLLFQVPTFDNAPPLDLDTALSQNSPNGGSNNGNGGGGNSNGSLFKDPGPEKPRLSRAELVKQIVDIIQENIDSDGWRDLGGNTGSLQELNGNLIITNTPANHREINGLLAQLREIRALQINVESRFMTVATNWFEKIGVDLDLFFNTNNDMFNAAKAVDPNFHLSDFFNSNGTLKDPVVFGSSAQVANPPPNPINTVPTGALIGVPDATGTNITYLIPPVGAPIRNTHGFSPIGIQQHHNVLVDQLADFDAASFAGVATANPALALGIQFLDDIQVDLLIQATQADKRSVVLTAPRLTFFNGQRAWTAVTTQTAFVSALTAVTGDASGAFQPTVGRLNDGFVLDVEGVISADRRYVTMTVIFQFSEFLGFRQSDAAEVTGAAGGGGTTGGTAAQFTGFVELPQIRVTEINTTVSVPDKGTVLLGGQRHVTEVEVEAGVPVLSKIPFINRFFTNRVTSKDEETLLILIRPEIIIQQENEDLLFPGLGDRLGSGNSYIR